MVAQGHFAVQQGAVFPVGPPHASLRLVAVATQKRGTPCSQTAIYVVGMNGAGPAPSDYIFPGQAQVVQPALIQEIDITVRAGGMNERGSGIDQQPKMIFALPQNLFSPLVLGNVRNRTHELKVARVVS